MLGDMNDDPERPAPQPIGHWMTTVPARQVALEDLQSEADKDALRINAEHDARMGLHPPQPTVRRVR
jgi:hypothetical protein